MTPLLRASSSSGARSLPICSQRQPASAGGGSSPAGQVRSCLRSRRLASSVGVTPTLLASRRDLKQLLTCPAAELPPPALAGWRWEQIGSDLAPLLDEARSKGVMP